MAKVLVRSAFGYDGDAVSAETSLRDFEETLTVQSEKDDCDINVLVRRFGIGEPVPVNVRVPLVGDFFEALDMPTALQRLREAELAFMELPARVRSRFNHDPAELVAFCSEKANLEEARKLGLAVEPAEVERVRPVTLDELRAAFGIAAPAAKSGDGGV